jgi:hypothetical protein
MVLIESQMAAISPSFADDAVYKSIGQLCEDKLARTILEENHHLFLIVEHNPRLMKGPGYGGPR